MLEIGFIFTASCKMQAAGAAAAHRERSFKKNKGYALVFLAIALGLEISAQNLGRSARFRAEISWESKKNAPGLPTRRESGALAVRLRFSCVWSKTLRLPLPLQGEG